MTTPATARSVLQHLVEAVPDAWRQDRIFRGAAIGAGVALAVLLVRSEAPRQDRPVLPPIATLPAAAPVVLAPVVRSPTPGLTPPTQTPAAEVPKIAPGHSLGDVTVAPTPDSDRFGTVKSGKHS